MSDLLKAVEHRQLEPYFQSVVDARSGVIVGMEALARWRRPDGEVSGPADFMQIAEDNDLVRIIDGIIFEKSAEFLREAKAAGVDVPGLSINLSEDHLGDDALIEHLRDLRDGTDAPVALELMETRSLDAPSDQLSWTIDAIRDLGLALEIDDFGTGRTSISSLLTLRPSRLKIARELVVAAPEDERHKKLLSCVLEIGKTLEIDVVAEGVETEAQKKLLLDLGCTLHQGFLYARPVSMSEQLDVLAAAMGERKVS